MAEEQMVAGDGWVSDDSSFYGSENERELQQSLYEEFKPQTFWSTHNKDPNVVGVAARKQMIREASTATTSANVPKANASKPFSMSGIDRQAMERERLARQSKLKRKAPPEPQLKVELFNFRQGSHDAWQLGETADDFVKRLPPDTTSISTCPWIWVENPRRNQQEKSTCPQVDQFTESGMQLLEQSELNRHKIQANGAGVPQGMLTKQLIQESKDLQQRIADLAVAHGVLSGKWMLFPKANQVNRVWAQVAQGVIDNRLGCSAKVATNDGNEERLLCIYTKDFRDVDEVSRVLAELETLGLLYHGRTLYYKHDAYTYLDIRSATASKYGLQASLYNSRTMKMAGKLPKASTSPLKKQSTLNKYF